VRTGRVPECSARLGDAGRIGSKAAPDHIEAQHRGGWVSLSISGLEVARVWINRRRVEFGIGEARIKLDHRNEGDLQKLIYETIARRRPETQFRNEMMFRFQPERWLESILSRDVTTIDATLDSRFAYSQVPTYRGEQRTSLTCWRQPAKADW